MQIRGAHYFNVVGKTRPDVTVQQAQAELEGIADRLSRQDPRTNANQTVQLVQLRDHLAGDLRASIGLLSGAVIVLLVIAMANAANLLMARAGARAREIAIRNAIGADGTRLMRQLLAETLLLAGLGCLLGLGVAQLGVRLIAALGPADIPALGSIGMDGRVVLFSSVLTRTPASIG